jgi:predicted amidophosphoribosyltransferase
MECSIRLTANKHMNYGFRQAKEIMERYNRAFEKALALQTIVDGISKKSPAYWNYKTRLQRANRVCTYIDKELQEHLTIIKPQIYEQV